MINKWEKAVKVSKELGDQYYSVINMLGEDMINAIFNTTLALYPDTEAMTDKEWTICMWKYHSAIFGRNLTELERDKCMRLAFLLYWNRDRYTSELQELTFGGGTEKEIVSNMKTLKGQCKTAVYDLTGDTVLYKNELVKTTAKMLSEVQNVFSIAITKLQTMSGRTATKDDKQIKMMASQLDAVNKEIVSIEGELGLKIRKSDQTVAEFNKALQAKVERFMLAHNGLFTWKCSKCGWQGVIVKQVPEEGSLINPLAERWLWKCPQCDAILAGGDKDPLFEGKVPFSNKAWELCKQGKLSLEDMAYILETSPRGIMYIVEEVLPKEIPAHIQEEFQKYEAANIQDYNAGVSEEGDLPVVDILDIKADKSIS